MPRSPSLLGTLLALAACVATTATGTATVGTDARARAAAIAHVEAILRAALGGGAGSPSR